MTDLQTMKNVLITSGYNEDSFIIIELKDTIELTLSKAIFVNCDQYDEVKTTFVYDKNEKLIEIY